ncbi:MAG: DNA (cytosine-5-)-methyltransferase [Deltaproteobacteria bacterium]|nr:DNA (cytosine-5-)-methyltransferase [Deltaproteobacteria bacterium]
MAHKKIKFIDLFCGIGGFRSAIETIGMVRKIPLECVFSSDIDKECQKAYKANFGELPDGDITKVNADDIPDYDILLAGFPCQPFSIIGQMKGFEDIRGTLFFDIARILEAKKPTAFVLENVKLLEGHNEGRTLKRILQKLSDLGYYTEYRILNALNFGLPQKRERIWIVGFKEMKYIQWPTGGKAMRPLSDVLEKVVPEKFYVSERIKNKRWSVLKPTKEHTIWHENKAGHISAYPFSCALRAGASYNYLLVNGERRLTPREMLRLQGFPESFKIVCNDSQTRKQAGNSLPVNVAEAVIDSVFETLQLGKSKNCEYQRNQVEPQLRLLEEGKKYNDERAKVKNSRKISSSISVK